MSSDQLEMQSIRKAETHIHPGPVGKKTRIRRMITVLLPHHLDGFRRILQEREREKTKPSR